MEGQLSLAGTTALDFIDKEVKRLGRLQAHILTEEGFDPERVTHISPDGVLTIDEPATGTAGEPPEAHAAGESPLKGNL